MRSVINVSSFWLLTCGSIYKWFVKNCTCLFQLLHPAKISPRMQFCLTSFLCGTLSSQCIFWSVQTIAGNQPSISVNTVRQLMMFMMSVRWDCCGADECTGSLDWSYAFHVPKGVFIIIQLTQIPLFSNCHTRVTILVKQYHAGGSIPLN